MLLKRWIKDQQGNTVCTWVIAEQQARPQSNVVVTMPAPISAKAGRTDHRRLLHAA